ncbi:MAG: ribbon-helix-helix protein, CopG family [Acidimicrobiales bacterium]
MRRTQFYLDEQVDEQLRQRAAAEGRSAAAVIREALNSYLRRGPVDAEEEDPIRAMAGTLRGLPADAAAEHDRELYGEHVDPSRTQVNR